MSAAAEKISFYLFGLFLLTYPVSVTVSQSAAVLAGITLIIGSFQNKHYLDGLKIPAIIYIFLLYFSFLLPGLAEALPGKKEYLRSEFSDIWMASILPVAWFHAQQPGKRQTIQNLVLVSFLLLVFSGLISLFTPFRLAGYIQAGFKVLPGARLQHFAGSIAGRFTYLPIGLMNTHLTFGGLLGLMFPGMVYGYFKPANRRSVMMKTVRAASLAAALIVIFFNQSRSVWMGLLFTMVIIMIRQRHALKQLLKQSGRIPYILAGFILLILLFGSIFKSNWLLQRSMDQLFKLNTIENQRYFIYKIASDMLVKKFPSGIGAGNFNSEYTAIIEQMMQQHEKFWYELSIVPGGHAHNDLLHFTVTGGVISLLLFLLFWFSLFRHLLNGGSLFYSGIFVVFIAGFFQCFLLDDEVVLPFYAFTGLFLADYKKNTKNFFTAITLLSLPLLVFVFYFAGLLSIPLNKVYTREIRSSHSEDTGQIRQSVFPWISPFAEAVLPQSHAKDGFRVEGCLDHHFGRPPVIRKEPFAIMLFITDSAAYPPARVKIRVYARDSFNQDRQYRVHESRVLAERTVTLHTGINRIQFTGIGSKEPAARFPDQVYFRDFEFFYEGFKAGSNFTLPVLFTGQLCDI